MELHELIETLCDFRDSRESYTGSCTMKVKVAQQPGWPLAADVLTVTRIGNTLWIATREDCEYAPKTAWEGGEFDSEPEDEDDED